jgi:hypothetical protein
MKAEETGYNIWHMECVEPAEAKVTYGNFPKYHTKILLSYCNFSKYHTKILLSYCNTKLARKDIFKPVIRNESLHDDSYVNGV